MGSMKSITLRPWELRDAPRLLQILRTTPDLERQLPRIPEDQAGCEELILWWGRARWVWCLAVEEEACGLVGISAENGRGWVFYWTSADSRGQGLASRAVVQACNWALQPQGGGLRRLELGYRVTNPASGRVAAAAGFRVEGREREKFVVDGVPVDVLVAGRLREDPWPAASGVLLEDVLPGQDPVGPDSGLSGQGSPWHHLELWVSDFDACAPAWRWLFQRLGAHRETSWRCGESWMLGDGSYVVIEASSDGEGPSNRRAPGMNHVAWALTGRDRLESVREAAPEQGWGELFADDFPHAGGPDHTALFLEHAVDGIEVELVLREPIRKECGA